MGFAKAQVDHLQRLFQQPNLLRLLAVHAFDEALMLAFEGLQALGQSLSVYDDFLL